ncbi:MAG: alpha/beta hydrolase-fold protein [Kofleriaceae bacterium]|nr:alpha/beta hydrolase-fold protein [Kofleriaceae bacterium]
MRAILSLALLVVACGPPGASTASPDASTGHPDTTTPDAPSAGCPAEHAGAACILALYDQAIADCDADSVEELRAELDARRELGPLWADARALFRTNAPTWIAGGWNDWAERALRTTAVCSSDLVLAAGAVPTGFWEYKLFDGATWSNDPHNPAFAYDDFAGNAAGSNSVLNTHDSGRGHLVHLPRACSTTLGNCRDVTAYLPAGYTAPTNAARTYPVLFMHDGQNLWNDHDCCFGHTGWELNVALDGEIAAARVQPLVVIGAASTTNRNNEYGLTPATMDAFMQFQVEELQPAALAHVRWDQQRLGVGGSSLGGLVSMHLALAYPQTYRAAASLSGAFWPGQDEGWALRDKLPVVGKQPLALYLDHGGNVANNSDGAADSVEVRDLLVSLGWQRTDSPICSPGDSALCYHSEPGATHDELAWKARAWRFLRFLYPE